MIFASLPLIFALTALPAAAPTGTEVDVELVLAVDMSGSMDIEEARVQKAGYVEALRHPEFLEAATGGLTGRIALSYVEWAGTVNPASLVEWRVIANAADAEAFAREIEARPTATRRGTSISNALDFATRLIVDNAYSGLRRVIDVSGDGPNNLGPPVVPARDAAVRSGVVVNGLAIMLRPSGSASGPPLDRYYADCVIGGPGAFVLPVQRAEDFAIAIRQKLVLEVSGLAPKPSVVPIIGMQTSDCLIGEKLRPSFLDR